WKHSGQLHLTQHWSVLNAASTILSALNKFNNGKLAGLAQTAPWWSSAAGVVLFDVPVLIALRPLIRGADKKERENLVYLLILIVLPFIAAALAEQVLGQFDCRYVIFAIAPYYVLVARGILGIKPAHVRSALLTACLFYSLVGLR